MVSKLFPMLWKNSVYCNMLGLYVLKNHNTLSALPLLCLCSLWCVCVVGTSIHNYKHISTYHYHKGRLLYPILIFYISIAIMSSFQGGGTKMKKVMTQAINLIFEFLKNVRPVCDNLHPWYNFVVRREIEYRYGCMRTRQWELKESLW